MGTLRRVVEWSESMAGEGAVRSIKKTAEQSITGVKRGTEAKNYDFS